MSESAARLVKLARYKHMATKKTRTDARQRRHARVRRKISGSSELPRLNVFRSLTGIYAQVINDEIGKTLVSASTYDSELKDKVKGMNKTEQARLVGETLAKRAIAMGIRQVVFDRGGFKYIGRVKALADGARDGGLKF